MAREEIVFTSGALLDLLSQIDELADNLLPSVQLMAKFLNYI